MISIKEGAKIIGIQSESILGLCIVSKVFEKFVVELVITEVTGGAHKTGSLHYAGLAVDIRSKNITDDLLKKLILENCKSRLGKNFDMILENEGQDNEHFHLEVDPK